MAVFAATMITAFILLGRWQLNRLEWRRQNNAVVVAHENAPVLGFAEAFRGPIGDGDQWQRVEVSGRYDTSRQFQIRYRNRGDARGVEVVTPLHADDGRTVLVDRGFLDQGAGPVPDVLPPAPEGEVRVVGYVRRNERGRGNAINPVDDRARLINAPAIGATLPYPVVDGYLGLISSEPAQGGDLLGMAQPELTEGPHLSYAVQWFCFTLIAVVGLIVLIRGDLRERRAQRGERAGQRTRAGRS